MIYVFYYYYYYIIHNYKLDIYNQHYTHCTRYCLNLRRKESQIHVAWSNIVFAVVEIWKKKAQRIFITLFFWNSFWSRSGWDTWLGVKRTSRQVLAFTSITKRAMTNAIPSNYKIWPAASLLSILGVDGLKALVKELQTKTIFDGGVFQSLCCDLSVSSSLLMPLSIKMFVESDAMKIEKIVKYFLITKQLKSTRRETQTRNIRCKLTTYIFTIFF